MQNQLEISDISPIKGDPIEELNFSTQKLNKSKLIETKVEQILRQNAQLLTENEQLYKQFSQKRTENDIWKTKYESQMNTIIQIKQIYDQEIKRLNQEIQQQKETHEQYIQEAQMEFEMNKQQAQSDSLLQIEHIKRSHKQNMQLFEEQLRKMKQLITNKEQEMENLKFQLQENREYFEKEQQRLIFEKEKIRNKLNEQEVFFLEENENQKKKNEFFVNQQIISLKKIHENETLILQNELDNFRNLLEVKNQEISDLIFQIQTLKINFECEIQILKEENEAFNQQLIQNNIFKEQEINEIQDKLVTLHTQDVEQLKTNQLNILEHLKEEKNQLQKLLQIRSEEIQCVILEKNQLGQYLEGERLILNSEIDSLKLKLEETIAQREKEYEQNQKIMNKMNQQHQEFQIIQKKQIKFLEEENEKLKNLLIQKNNELDVNIFQFKNSRNYMENENKEFLEKIQKLEVQLIDLEEEKKKFENQFLEEINFKKIKFDEFQKKTNSQIFSYENQIKRLKENLDEQDEELKNVLKIKNYIENEKKQLNEQNQNLYQQIVNLETQKAQEMQEITQKITISNNYQIKILKQTHENQQNILLQENSALKIQLENKENKLQEYINNFQKLESFRNYQKMSNTDIDYTQKQAEVNTSRNLYEIYIKSNEKQQQHYRKRKQSLDALKQITNYR
ncbi:tetrin c, putative [Ichthyophthirius multifiliis]|uniref:Tetrin c, putative n=1 Tax=Ichthyophthirius multifiliis TaxID=5932 RepID=G0QQB6_ICHMU|nr:tetrin c, putative [Ichthyophthirius multifiliis]EGR32617.1 tetrin c, putative [Ichthyophthirius multifiliis]|eukprot:XP_004036603.1 tetrin c, putative [Ichthyophthirius multifiliis]